MRGIKVASGVTGFVIAFYSIAIVQAPDKSSAVFWGLVGGLGLFVIVFGVAALPDGVRAIRRRRTTTRSLIEKGEKYDTQSERVSELENAVAGWQDRAEHAEIDAYARGRRRVAAEVAGAVVRPSFGRTDFVERDGQIVIYAEVTSANFPPEDSIYFVVSDMSRDVKAVLRCVGFENESTVLLRVEEFRSLDAEQLLGTLSTHSGLPASMSIVARSLGEDFGTER